MSQKLIFCEMDNNKKCKCGYKLGDPWVVPKARYSFWGWFVVSVGISYPPVEVRYECDKCGEVFKSITDKKLLRTHAYR